MQMAKRNMRHPGAIITFIFLFFWLFFWPFFWQVQAAWAQDIIVIKSLNIQPYNETLEGFKKNCNSNILEYSISENDSSGLIKKIRTKRPDLILTIGLRALNHVRGVKNVPIVYSMVSNPQPLPSGENNITGVSMNISAKKQLSVFIKGIPAIKRIGIVYDPSRTSRLFADASEAASSLGITVVSRAVQDPKDVPSVIKGMIDKIDAFWMLPDATVITPEALKYLFLTSVENNVPVLTFSEKYIEKGALISLNIDANDIGQQACEMARNIINGADIKDIPESSPRKAVVSFNARAAEKMGITVNTDIMQKSWRSF